MSTFVFDNNLHFHWEITVVLDNKDFTFFYQTVLDSWICNCSFAQLICSFIGNSAFSSVDCNFRKNGPIFLHSPRPRPRPRYSPRSVHLLCYASGPRPLRVGERMIVFFAPLWENLRAHIFIVSKVNLETQPTFCFFTRLNPTVPRQAL